MKILSLDSFTIFISGQWYIQPFTANCQSGETFEFPEYKFTSVSPPPKFDEDEYEDNAQAILIGQNAVTGLPIIYDTKYRERLEKSDTGLPIAR